MVNKLAIQLTSPVTERKTVALFCKALSVYLLIKVLMTWSVVIEMAKLHKFAQPKAIWSWVIFAPGVFGTHHITIFLILIIVLALGSVIRPIFFIAILLAWFSFNFYRLTFPIANGADQILVTLLILAVPLAEGPRFGGERAAILFDSAHNFALLLCKIYVVSIYFISGIDKLGSPAWRSGDAFLYVSQLDYMLNPNVNLIPDSPTGRMILSWFAILFELAFPVLIWFGSTRIWICITGIIFHLVIGVLLSLPDFAGVMIASYLVFFNQSDHFRLKNLIKRQ